MASNNQIPDCGKTVCPIAFPDGTIGSFHNSVIDNIDNVSWKNEYGKEKYSLSFDPKDKEKKYRALYWHKYLPNEAKKELRIVPYVKESTTATPIYEAITPQVGQLTGTQGFNLLFWSNLNEDVSSLNEYNPELIYKIPESMIYSVSLSDVSNKALFSASVRFEMLQQSGGGVNDSNCVLTPVITNISPLFIDKKPISDFIVNGGYNGMFKTYAKFDPENPDSSPVIYVVDGIMGEQTGSSDAGICYINQYQFNVPSYSFDVLEGMNYIMLYSSGISNGEDVEPTQPEWVVESSFPEQLDEECYILIARVKYESSTNTCIVSQENYGIARGFIFAECEDDTGESETT